ncbi:MAG: hypothetical protein Q8L89_00940 [Gammaproteobacteria bacterium]|nr:hypothetical protein [Gammaproteobacteria bacterium]
MADTNSIINIENEIFDAMCTVDEAAALLRTYLSLMSDTIPDLGVPAYDGKCLDDSGQSAEVRMSSRFYALLPPAHEQVYRLYRLKDKLGALYAAASRRALADGVVSI